MFTIYMGELVGSWFGKVVSKIQDWQVSSRNSVTEIRPRRSEIGIKDGFQEMEHEFSFGTFRSGKQDYFFRRSATPGNFPPKRPET